MNNNINNDIKIIILILICILIWLGETHNFLFFSVVLLITVANNTTRNLQTPICHDATYINENHIYIYKL